MCLPSITRLFLCYLTLLCIYLSYPSNSPPPSSPSLTYPCSRLSLSLSVPSCLFSFLGFCSVFQSFLVASFGFCFCIAYSYFFFSAVLGRSVGVGVGLLFSGFSGLRIVSLTSPSTHLPSLFFLTTATLAFQYSHRCTSQVYFIPHTFPSPAYVDPYILQPWSRTCSFLKFTACGPHFYLSTIRFLDTIHIHQ